MRLTPEGAAVANEMWAQLKDENPETDDPILLWLERVTACPELWTDEPGFMDWARGGEHEQG